LLLQPDGAVTDPGPAHKARVMLIDDEPAIIEVLEVYLGDAGFTDIVVSTDASRAMALMRTAPPDIVITDLMMPEVSGFEILRRMRADQLLSHIPVIILTGYNDPENKLRALELGATDFLSKPVDPSELVLRMRNNFAIKHYQDDLQQAYQRAHRLLLGILPPSVARRLELGETDLVDYFANATVLFADLTGSTNVASDIDAARVAQLRNHVFKSFDRFVDKWGLEKINTSGGSYMLVGGLNYRSADHARCVVDAGLAMLSIAEGEAVEIGTDVQLRIGVHTGSVVAGVAGPDRTYYDLWGDTVNVASRMESTSIRGCLQISDVTRRFLDDDYSVEARDASETGNEGGMKTFFVLGRGI
jgi:CheY-like chemotaxis protein